MVLPWNDPFGALQELPQGQAQLLGRERDPGEQSPRTVARIGQGLTEEAVATAGHHQRR